MSMSKSAIYETDCAHISSFLWSNLRNRKLNKVNSELFLLRFAPNLDLKIIQ